MNPIINPMWFYWIDILVSFDFLLTLLIVILLVGLFIGVPMLLYSYSEYQEYELVEESQQGKMFKRMFNIVKLSLITLLISSVIVVAIPSEKTFYKMMVAKCATSNNIDVVLEKITEGVDYIFDKIESKD